jgi:hypothetical protein
MSSFIVPIVMFVIYFLPGWIAISRNHNNCNSILMVNIFLGWSFIGWVFALVWAFTNDVKITPVPVQVVRSNNDEKPMTFKVKDDKSAKVDIEPTNEGTIIFAMLLFLGILASLIIFAGSPSKPNNSNSSTSYSASATEKSNIRVPTDEAGETIATAINLNGLLCAKVKYINKLELTNTFEVTCTTYRGGESTSTYILNSTTGKAFQQ